MKKLLIMISFCLVLSSCNKPIQINNKYLKAKSPSNYVDITKFENNDILYLSDQMKNGLESIFSIDNEQDLTIQPNSKTIQEFSPKERLISRLKSIELDALDPNFPWQHFTITEQPKDFIFKGYKASEATFTVEENVNHTGKIIKKKIKRIIVFTDKDLWNFVLAPSELESHESEMKIFNDILESIEIKK